MMARLVPSPEQRRVLTADIARVPRSFYDDAVPLPGGWATRPGHAYLQLGPAYDDDRARAVELGP